MTFSVERLPNGASIAVAEMPHVESVSVGLWLAVGGRHEPQRLNGISHFLEHILFKGTNKRNAREISEAVEGVGGYLNAFTAEEMTCYYAKASVRHLPILLDVLLDMLLDATFPDHEIERERGVICEEIRMYEDRPEQVAQEHLGTLMWPSHPLGRSLSGSEASVNRMTREQLIDYRKKNYHAGNLWITVAGNTSLPEVKELLKKYLRRLPSGPPATYRAATNSQRAPRVKVAHKPIEQTQLALALRGVSRHDPRRSALRLMSVILGENMSSRLFQVIREKHGLAYSVSSSVAHLHDTGALAVSAGVENNKLDKALKLTLQTIQAMTRRAPSARELRRAKEYTLGQMTLSLESTTNQMMWLGDTALGHGRVLDPAKVFRQIESVTAEEVRQVANYIVSDRRLNLAIVSPEATEDQIVPLTHFN